jgi:hypothetical protein
MSASPLTLYRAARTIARHDAVLDRLADRRAHAIAALTVAAGGAPAVDVIGYHVEINPDSITVTPRASRIPAGWRQRAWLDEQDIA